MAIFHLHVKNISRGSGRSVVAAAAYRAGETLPNESEERLSAFGGRRDVLHNEIALPADAPDWMADRAQLWNAVETAEKRKDARLAKEIEVALPRELPKAAWLVLARQLATAYAAQGFVADFAIHDDGTAHNPHVHVLLTTRVVSLDGFGGKIRSADGRQFVEEARALWSKLANEALVNAGLSVSIDPRSHALAGLDRTPTEHRGPDAAERRSRREKMGLSRLLPPKAKLDTQDDRERMLKDWPVSQMGHRFADDNGLPVPDPNGGLISQSELDQAQERMLSEMKSTPDKQAFDMSQSRRWTERAEPTTTEKLERDKPFMSQRWEKATPDREDVETHNGAFQSRRWERSDEPERESAREEPVRERD